MPNEPNRFQFVFEGIGLEASLSFRLTGLARLKETRV